MISEFDQATLVLVARMPRERLAEWVRLQTRPYGVRAADRALDIIKNLQIALHTYSKTHPYDFIQERMLKQLGRIEKWVRLEYERVKFQEIMRDRPDLIDDPKQIKRIVMTNWENYFKSRCY